jgi:hypothetical protein
MSTPQVFFASPRRLPDPARLPGRVVVLDIAFAADGSGGVSFNTVTRAFLDGLGDRLAAWVDHHDHPLAKQYNADERFLLVTKQKAGACPQMITPELVARVGPVQTLVAHLDLDGIYAAAKWMLGGHPPYAEADADALAVDTRTSTPSGLGETIDFALRAAYRDDSLRHRIIRFLTTGCPRDGQDWELIVEARDNFAAIAEHTREVAADYHVEGRVAVVRIPPRPGRVDKTYLLLLGQELAEVAVVQQSGMITVAAGFDSGFDFPRLLGLGGGMPTRASAPEDRLPSLLEALNGPGDRT